MLKRHWLWYATIACAVLILSGCCHDRIFLRGDWSIGLDGTPIGGCSAPGCTSGPIGHSHGGHGGLSPALAVAEENPLGWATPHAKFHPVPTRPVFSPKTAMPVAQPSRRGVPTPAVRSPEPPGEELYLPDPKSAEEQVAYAEPLPQQSGTTGVQRGDQAAWFFEPAPQPPASQSANAAGSQSVVVAASQSVMIPSSAIKPAPTTTVRSSKGSASGWRARRTP